MLANGWMYLCTHSENCDFVPTKQRFVLSKNGRLLCVPDAANFQPKSQNVESEVIEVTKKTRGPRFHGSHCANLSDIS